MIIKELYKTLRDGTRLFVQYSDLRVYIQNTDTQEIFDAAIDPEDMLEYRNYAETDIPIPDPDPEPEEPEPESEVYI